MPTHPSSDPERQDDAWVPEHIKPRDPGGHAAAASFAAKEAIESGEWDRFLKVLAGAIKVRQRKIAEQASPEPPSLTCYRAPIGVMIHGPGCPHQP
jgi:hypothetical protein